jgi:hypothetical protein
MMKEPPGRPMVENKSKNRKYDLGERLPDFSVPIISVCKRFRSTDG